MPLPTRLLAFGVGLLVPLAFSNMTFDPSLLPKWVMADVVVLACGVALLLQAVFRRQNTALPVVWLGLLGGLLGLSLLSTVHSLNLSESHSRNLNLGMLVAFFAVSCAGTGQMGSNRGLIKVLIAGIFLIALAGFIQYNELYFMFINGWAGYPPFLTMANPKIYGAYLMLGLFPLIYGTWLLKGFWRFLSRTGIVLVSLNIILIESLSLFLAVGSGLLLVWLLTFGREPARQLAGRLSVAQVVLLATSAGALLFFGLLFALPPASDTLYNTLLMYFGEQPEVRLKLWDGSCRMVQDYWLTGVGAGNWPIRIPEYFSQNSTIVENSPHNDLLLLASETGIGGAILYLAVLALPPALAIRSYLRAGEDDKATRVAALAFLFTGWAFGVYSLFYFPFSRPEQILYFLFLAALQPGLMPTGLRMLRLNWIGTAAMAGCAILISAGAYLYHSHRLELEVGLRQVLIDYNQENWPEVIREVDQLESPVATLSPHFVPVVWYRGMAHFSLNQPEKALADFKLAYEHNPNHFQVVNNLAGTYATLHRFPEAIQFYKKNLQHFPNDTESLLNLAAVYYNNGQTAEALQTLEHCPLDEKRANEMREFILQ